MDKPLWVTETSVLCDVDCDAAFEQAQAEYFDYVMANAKEHGIEGVMWFMSGYNGWRNSDLVRADYSRKPVYYRYEQRFEGIAWRAYP